jgi:hypothetical protein
MIINTMTIIFYGETNKTAECFMQIKARNNKWCEEWTI